MNIGIFTYGTRGDLQPYIALAHELKSRGHSVTISASEDFKEFVESYDLPFFPLWGNAERIMNSNEGRKILKTENSIELMKYYFKFLHDNRYFLRKSYFEAVANVDFIIANSMTLPIISALAEKYNKKIVLTYFMPPVVVTKEFPLGDLDFFNFPWYNKLTYKIAHYFFWRFIKNDTNEYRKELGLPELKENLIKHIDKQKILDLYCISPSLIKQPKDWETHHKIMGVINIPLLLHKKYHQDVLSEELSTWLKKGKKPIYIGFGSNGIGNVEKINSIIQAILTDTDERVLFCTGWSTFCNLPHNERLFVTKNVNHEIIFPMCKIGVFHGGAGTLATMLRHKLPIIIISFYTDQPTWGKIIERKKLGVHIPIKRLNSRKFLSAIKRVQNEKMMKNFIAFTECIKKEDGLIKTSNEIENYFNQK